MTYTMTAMTDSTMSLTRRTPITAMTRMASVLLVALLLTSVAGCGGNGEKTESGEAGNAKAGEGTKAGADAHAAGEAADEKEGVELVVLDSTQLRLGGIVVEPVTTITTSGLPVTGTITYDANRVSHVGSRTDGRVVALRVELGTQVRRGQTLALLESPEVGQIRAEEREARELVKIAEENFARERRLAAQGISSRKELLEAEAELRRMQASLRSAQTRLRVFGATNGSGAQFGVTAPFTGQVVARDASVGEMANPEDTLFTVADLSRVWIELNIFERDLPRVRVGQSVVVRTSAYPNRTFPGRIVFVGSILNPANRTVEARVEIENADGALKPGMFANASIQVGAGGPVVVAVPQDAVQEVEGKKVVFVPGTKAGEFRPQPIAVGESIEGGRVTIPSGLAPDARVVTRGAFALRSELAKGEIGEHGH
jgi:cobalt-zinc-cadmium efflux system membrane fusion protein